MVQEPAAQTTDAAHCPWCSAPLPSSSEERCPSCGATLVGENESSLPGVTAIDAEAIVRNARSTSGPKRSRLLSWISGEDTETDEAPAPPGSLAPPPPDVRREILRLELEAEVANLQAEADSILADEQAETSEGAAPTASATDDLGTTDTGEPTTAIDSSLEPPARS